MVIAQKRFQKGQPHVDETVSLRNRFHGRMVFLASADEPVPQNAASKSRPQNTVPQKTPVGREDLPESDAAEDEALPLIAAKESPDQPAIKLVDDAFVKAYEAGDAKAIVACFTPDAEYVDEAGTVFEGRESIEACLTAFFEENPDASWRSMRTPFAQSVRVLSFRTARLWFLARMAPLRSSVSTQASTSKQMANGWWPVFATTYHVACGSTHLS